MKAKITDFADSELLKDFRSLKSELKKFETQLRDKVTRADELRAQRSAAVKEMESLDEKRHGLLKRVVFSEDPKIDKQLDGVRRDLEKHSFVVKNVDEILPIVEEVVEELKMKILSIEKCLDRVHSELFIGVCQSAIQTAVVAVRPTLETAWLAACEINGLRLWNVAWEEALDSFLKEDITQSLGADYQQIKSTVVSDADRQRFKKAQGPKRRKIDPAPETQKPGIQGLVSTGAPCSAGVQY